jgi:hypothetical protein
MPPLNPNSTPTARDPLQAELVIDCASLKKAADSPEIIAIRADAAKLGFTTKCQATGRIPARLEVDISADPKVQMLAQKVRNDRNDASALLESAPAYDNAFLEKKLHYANLLKASGIALKIEQLQLSSASESAPAVSTLIPVVDVPKRTANTR